ncbi:hypothetical protein HBB16_08045 [Pseudonocardia sp. MCCB 268]|nr:hypothetical protein [Pseudonocardia cytotoxica]
MALASRTPRSTTVDHRSVHLAVRPRPGAAPDELAGYGAGPSTRRVRMAPRVADPHGPMIPDDPAARPAGHRRTGPASGTCAWSASTWAVARTWTSRAWAVAAGGLARLGPAADLAASDEEAAAIRAGAPAAWCTPGSTSSWSRRGDHRDRGVDRLPDAALGGDTGPGGWFRALEPDGHALVVAADAEGRGRELTGARWVLAVPVGHVRIRRSWSRPGSRSPRRVRRAHPRPLRRVSPPCSTRGRPRHGPSGRRAG